MLKQVGYDQIYSFKYSSRPGTRAADYEDVISDEDKRDRLARCQALQDKISQAILKEQVGKISEVLVTGPSKRGHGEWSGRTPESRIVNFPAPNLAEIAAGDICQVKIIEAFKHSLKGEVVA
jgi:tRNA-2-methylthio-N6-dimethylallyladenosine synthase